MRHKNSRKFECFVEKYYANLKKGLGYYYSSELSRLKKVIEKCRYECRRAMSLWHSLYKNHNVSSLS